MLELKKHRLTKKHFLRNGEDIALIKKLKPALIILTFSSMQRNLCFGPETISL